MEAITRFRGAYSFLSNFYPVSIEYDGQVYAAVEDAFQAAKTLDPKERMLIQLCQTPGDAKRCGRKVTLRSDWNEIKIDVMHELLRKKFQNPMLRKKLLDTGDADLVEGNTHGDTFWGQVKGVGENHLGKLLMEVRAEIIRGDA